MVVATNSVSINRSTSARGKPIAFSTATSVTRSRAAIVMVIAASRMIMKIEQTLIDVSRNFTLPNMFTNWRLNSFSVNVSVGSGLFLNAASMVWLICALRSLPATRVQNVPQRFHFNVSLK